MCYPYRFDPPVGRLYWRRASVLFTLGLASPKHIKEYATYGKRPFT